MIKKLMIKKWKNIEAILGYLDKNIITFPEGENNPRTLLQQLRKMKIQKKRRRKFYLKLKIF